MPDIFVDDNPQDKKVESKEKSEKTKDAISLLNKDKVHKHTHIFSSYCEMPPHVTFADRLEGEELLLFLRRHFITNVPWIVKAILLGLVPVILMLIDSISIINLDFLPANTTLMITLFYYFLVFGYVFANYLTWFYNISLVTTERIIDIDFSNIVFENVEATKLTQVEDVGYVQIGVIRSIFDYGDVNLHTAGPASNFEFLAVPHPERVIKTINNLTGESNNA